MASSSQYGAAGGGFQENVGDHLRSLSHRVLNSQRGDSQRQFQAASASADGASSVPASSTAEGEAKVSAKIAAGRAVQILMKQEIYGSCHVSPHSVYGAAIAMPQVARSSGWSRTWTALAVRAFVHLFLNYAIQYTVLYQIALKGNCMNYYSGRMHLCNFGKYFDQCPSPGTTDCVGPGGSNYTKATLYSSFTTWSARRFFRDSLMKAYPDRADEIMQEVTVGEFGIESPVCRIFCLFLFMMQIVEDFTETLNMLHLINSVPTAADSWLNYEPPSWASKSRAKQVLGKTEMDYVIFRVAGMPRAWKLLNVFVIVIPKLFIWASLAINGFQFLMETGGIQNLILNSLAMTFILQIDELLASRLCTTATKETMNKLKAYRLFDLDREENAKDEEVLEEFDARDGTWKVTNGRFLLMLLPRRLLMIIAATCFFYCYYFVRFCNRLPDGSFVSESIYPPKEIQRFGSFYLKWLFYPPSIERVDQPTWVYPNHNFWDPPTWKETLAERVGSFWPPR